MLPSNFAVKTTAKTALKNKWPQAVTVCMMFVAVFLVQIFFEQLLYDVALKLGKQLDEIGFLAFGVWENLLSVSLTLCSLAMTFFVVFPLLLGVIRWFWRLTDGVTDSVGVAFYYFGSGDRFKKAVALFFGLVWRNFLIVLVSFIPFFAAVVLTNLAAEYDINQMMLFGADLGNAINTIFLFVGYVLFLGAALRYYTVLWTAVAYPDLSVKEVFEFSVKTAKGTKSVYLLFAVSFTGWAVISLLALPLLFTLPYFFAANAVFSRLVITNAANKD